MKLWTTILLLTFILQKGFSQTSDGTEEQSHLKKSWKEYNSRLEQTFWSHDTIVKKGKKFRLSNFAIQIGGGGSKLFHDNKTEKYLGNYWCNSSHFDIFYKKFFFGGSLRVGTLKIIDSLDVGDRRVSGSSELDIFNFSLTLGYNITIANSISITPYMGLLSSSLSVPFDYHNMKRSTGLTTGFAVHKYFTVRPKRQLGVFLGGNYNLSNYHDWNRNLGDYFISLDLGVEYKFWILQKIK
jgi:hypothetical protein